MIRSSARLSLALLLLACGSSASPKSLTSGGGSADWPNEPAGFTRITEHPFNTLTNNDTAGTAIWTDDHGMTIASDATAPKSPPNVGLFTYPGGFVGGSASGAIEYDHIPAYTQLYLSFWMKLSPNFQGQSSSTNKVLFFWDNGKPAVFLSNEGKGTTADLMPTMRYQGGVDSREYFYQNQGNDQPMTRNVWRRWELVLVANTPGQSNGVMRWWIDGTKVGEYTDVEFVGSGTSPDWQYIYLEPIWGGTGDSVTSTQTLSVDHLYLSGRP